jgi:hypothetical protein
MKSKVDSKIQIGFFKRILSSFKFKDNSKQKLYKEMYYQDWDKIKWKIRFAKVFTASFIYFFGKFVCYDSVINKYKIKNENESLKDDLLNAFDKNWGKANPYLLKELEMDKNEVKGLIQIEFEKYDKKNEISHEKKTKLTISIFKNVLQNFKLLRSKTENDPFFENSKNIDFDEIKKIMYLVKILRKYNLEEASKETKPLLLAAEYFILLNSDYFLNIGNSKFLIIIIFLFRHQFYLTNLT